MAFWKTMTQTICCHLFCKQLLPEENVDIFYSFANEKKKKIQVK